MKPSSILQEVDIDMQARDSSASSVKHYNNQTDVRHEPAYRHGVYDSGVTNDQTNPDIYRDSISFPGGQGEHKGESTTPLGLIESIRARVCHASERLEITTLRLHGVADQISGAADPAKDVPFPLSDETDPLEEQIDILFKYLYSLEYAVERLTKGNPST